MWTLKGIVHDDLIVDEDMAMEDLDEVEAVTEATT